MLCSKRQCASTECREDVLKKCTKVWLRRSWLVWLCPVTLFGTLPALSSSTRLPEIADPYSADQFVMFTDACLFRIELICYCYPSYGTGTAPLDSKNYDIAQSIVHVRMNLVRCGGQLKEPRVRQLSAESITYWLLSSTFLGTEKDIAGRADQYGSALPFVLLRYRWQPMRARNKYLDAYWSHASDACGQHLTEVIDAPDLPPLGRYNQVKDVKKTIFGEK